MCSKDIETFGISDLKELYTLLLGKSPPPRAKKGFLLGNIAWSLQSQSQGYNYLEAREQLISAASRAPSSAKASYIPGTRIIREWNGITHEVVAEESGFRWRGNKYKSLSHIARKITGTRWSGPRFFGLNNSDATKVTSHE